MADEWGIENRRVIQSRLKSIKKKAIKVYGEDAINDRQRTKTKFGAF